MPITTQDPDKLREPENMSAAIVAKCHASNQCELIDEEIRRLRSLRRRWNKRLGVCLKKISKETSRD